MEKIDNIELDYRRRAMRLSLRGLRPCDILKQIPRSRPWLLKWQTRFAAQGWPGLVSHSRRPHSSPHSYGDQARATVIRVRRRLESRHIGLIGARAVQQEIRQQHLLRPVPSLASINRWLKAAGLLAAEAPPPTSVWYPEPCFASDIVLHAMDWTARYLEGGVKIFAFHTVDQRTRALAQTISSDKSLQSVRRHALEVWHTLGLPDALQLDNDTAFSGGARTPRRFGTFVRLCLYLGIELIFVPPAEPRRNWLVEGLNGLWAHSFWERDHFRSVAEVKRKSRKFVTWYTNQYYPPALGGLTPAQAQRKVRRRRLTKQQAGRLPEQLPITAGRVHFIRRVGGDGTISLLGERWKVGKRLAHRYVRATIVTHCRRLEIYHQRSEGARLRMVKEFHYEISEAVRRISPEFKR